MEHPAATRARDYLATFAAGDTEALRDFFDDDVVWHVGGRHRLSGAYCGKDALLDYFARARELTRGSLRLREDAVLADDRHTAMFTRVTGVCDGRLLDVQLAQTFKAGADGRWREYFALSNDQAAVDVFWGSR